MSGGWGTPARVTAEDVPPVGAVCVEGSCGYPAARLRPAEQEWLTDTGVLNGPDVSEWVCALHAPD